MAGDYLRSIHKLLQGLRDGRVGGDGGARTMRTYVCDTFGVLPESAEFAKYVSGIFDQIAGAEDIIRESSKLTDESKRGLIQTIQILKRHFPMVGKRRSVRYFQRLTLLYLNFQL